MKESLVQLAINPFSAESGYSKNGFPSSPLVNEARLLRLFNLNGGVLRLSVNKSE